MGMWRYTLVVAYSHSRTLRLYVRVFAFECLLWLPNGLKKFEMYFVTFDNFYCVACHIHSEWHIVRRIRALWRIVCLYCGRVAESKNVTNRPIGESIERANAAALSFTTALTTTVTIIQHLLHGRWQRCIGELSWKCWLLWYLPCAAEWLPQVNVSK